MTASCFIKKDSNPPVCGVHNVALVQYQLTIDSNAPNLGHVTCYRCPISQAVALDMKKDKAQSSIRSTRD
jgi:hypothetical protein